MAEVDRLLSLPAEEMFAAIATFDRVKLRRKGKEEAEPLDPSNHG